MTKRPIVVTDSMPRRSRRTRIPRDIQVSVLTESGYRCAVPTCRGILAIDLHHIEEVSVGGGNELSNLIALCPTCHALYHRGTMSPDSIYVYKAMIVSLSRAFDIDAVDKLIFLSQVGTDYLVVSGDGLLHFSRLIAAGLAVFEQKANNNWQIVTYTVNISQRGRQLIEAWKIGDRAGLGRAIAGVPAEEATA